MIGFELVDWLRKKNKTAHKLTNNLHSFWAINPKCDII